MSKHTEGPWRVKQWDDCTLAVESCDGKFNICTMADDDDGGHMPDARLIAAAPELLAACKLALEDYAQMGCSHDPDKPDPDRCACCAVQYAIARAE